ncbi:bZIP transcription factor 60-like [Tripterygium wilfordii]|uniref:bZIP transcription factor 60-like n=1 Tax=Tripterygium wilfordii TaxID=458696 RepID=UPI0018F85BBC|nr:bZIP transcription factor 60-like [Tripterygium wilfordii]
MENTEFLVDDDVSALIDWDILDESPDFAHIFATGAPASAVPSAVHESSENSPDSAVSTWLGEMENLLMKDDDDSAADLDFHSCEDFVADILFDSNSRELCDVSTDKESSGSESEKKEKQDTVDGSDVNGDDEDADDPVTKKRRRQMRNRDAAVRSRERKKMYVRDLEMKSRYLEGEYRRLGRLLQCFVAENQALRLTLQKASAFGASSAKQESAVLLLESLLLGSLLWFLGIVCLFSLRTLPLSNVGEVPLGNLGKKGPESLVPKGAGSNMFLFPGVQLLVNNRRCKASRTKMKPRVLFREVLV